MNRLENKVSSTSETLAVIKDIAIEVAYYTIEMIMDFLEKETVGVVELKLGGRIYNNDNKESILFMHDDPRRILGYDVRLLSRQPSAGQDYFVVLYNGETGVIFESDAGEYFERP